MVALSMVAIYGMPAYGGSVSVVASSELGKCVARDLILCVSWREVILRYVPT